MPEKREPNRSTMVSVAGRPCVVKGAFLGRLAFGDGGADGARPPGTWRPAAPPSSLLFRLGAAPVPCHFALTYNLRKLYNNLSPLFSVG